MFSIFKKFITNSNNIPSISKNIQHTHPHDMAHVPAKFRENTLMRFWVTVRCNISRSGPSAPREIKMIFRAIQPNPSYDMLSMSSQRRFMPKKRKSYWSVSVIPVIPLLKVDANDDGWVSIWKAPLPDGTAERKSNWR